MSMIWLIGRGDACRDCRCGAVGDGGDGTIGDGIRRSLRNDGVGKLSSEGIVWVVWLKGGTE